ncbi:hypothetical protein BG004_003409 [Podila humilis]|nr:hypothetical protein BG004_003409 [Podila humilis]
MIAASVQNLPLSEGHSNNNNSPISRFLTGLTKATEYFVAPENYEASIQFVQDKMDYTRQDVQDWFSGVRYPSSTQPKKTGGCATVSKDALLTCSHILLEAGVIQPDQEQDVKSLLFTKYVHTQVAKLV